MKRGSGHHALRDNHDRLRAIMRDYATALSASHGDVHTALLPRRVDFAQLFSAHIVDERAAARRTLPIEVAGAADAEMLALFHDYSAHVRAWTPARIAAEPSTYNNAVLALQSRLKARLDWAERELLPRLPAAAPPAPSSLTLSSAA